MGLGGSGAHGRDEEGMLSKRAWLDFSKSIKSSISSVKKGGHSYFRRAKDDARGSSGWFHLYSNGLPCFDCPDVVRP